MSLIVFALISRSVYIFRRFVRAFRPPRGFFVFTPDRTDRWQKMRCRREEKKNNVDDTNETFHGFSEPHFLRGVL